MNNATNPMRYIPIPTFLIMFSLLNFIVFKLLILHLFVNYIIFTHISLVKFSIYINYALLINFMIKNRQDKEFKLYPVKNNSIVI